MGATSRPSPAGLWELVRRQHGTVTRRQLLELGFSVKAITHRIDTGRLHPVRRGVYAVGRPELGLHGWWMAAVLGCGRDAVLSHQSAAALWGLRRVRIDRIDVSVPTRSGREPPGIHLHRRGVFGIGETTQHRGIPVTSPICTVIDVAADLSRDELEAAISEGDKRGHLDPEKLRQALDGIPRRPGSGVLRKVLDQRTFTLTDSQLERLFLPLAREAGLPKPQTGRHVSGFRVDFYWPDLALVVETDGLRYHRTPAQQARDRLRDQAHTRAGLTPLRFTRAQVRFQPQYVRETLEVVARRLSPGDGAAGGA